MRGDSLRKVIEADVKAGLVPFFVGECPSLNDPARSILEGTVPLCLFCPMDQSELALTGL